MMDDDSPDERETELETLEAIYPEIRRPDATQDPFTFEIDIPVKPEVPVTVTFPAVVGNDPVALGPGASGRGEVDSSKVTHLPSLLLRISLPPGYPSLKPPDITITTNPPWLRQSTLDMLASDAPRLWEEIGRDMVAYTYIDHLQRSADDIFGTAMSKGTLEVDVEHKLAVLDHDIKAKKEEFERETFDCEVCLDPKKGSKCHMMLDCGHIFCLECLHDFYNDAITEGNTPAVRCLAPSCAKDRADAIKREGKKTRNPKTSVSPSELLQIGLSEETVKRYVMLKYKTELESDKNTIYCPRQWCNGAARSKKHKKPAGLNFEDVSDAESEHEDDEKEKTKPFNTADLLAICEECNFAFCSRCLQTWHGEFVLCAPKRNKDELTEEEKASLDYLKLHTSPCPTCSAPAQKTHGCNHMICSRCETHFCYLCSSWLEPENPYKHYNEQPGGKVTGCYMRLWELEEGDGDDVGLGFLGGNRLPVAQEEPPAPQPARRDAARERHMEPEHGRRDRVANMPQQRYQPGPDPMAVAREAPLVLRLGHDPNVPQPVAPPEPPAPAPPPPAGAGRGNNQRGRGGGAQRGQPAARARGQRGGRRNQRGRGHPPVEAVDVGLDPGNGGMVVLDEAQEAWVRRFVEMALLDAEDEVEEDSGEDDLFWPH